jgi:hypothetical protein
MHRGQAFLISGTIADRPVQARWAYGQLQADPELLGRAEVVMGDGDQFTDDGIRILGPALHNGPLSALITLMRCFDVITVCEFAPWIGDEFDGAELARYAYGSTAPLR